MTKKGLTPVRLLVGVAVIVFVIITVKAFIAKNDAGVAKSASAQSSYAIGDTFNDGNFTYTITEAKRDGKIVTVKARAKNTGKKAETLYGGSMKLRDSNGNFYDNKSDGLAKGTLNPGLESEGEITFEVPEDATGLKAAVNTDVIKTTVANKLDNDADFTIIEIGL